MAENANTLYFIPGQALLINETAAALDQPGGKVAEVRNTQGVTVMVVMSPEEYQRLRRQAKKTRRLQRRLGR